MYLHLPPPMCSRPMSLCALRANLSRKADLFVKLLSKTAAVANFGGLD